MSLLRPALENSLLLRPWVSLAKSPTFRVGGWFRNAKIGRLMLNQGGRVLRPLRQVGRNLPLNPTLWLVLLSLGVAGLFALLCFQETGVIGAATLLLLGVVLLMGLLYPVEPDKKLNIVDLLVAAFFLSALLSTAFSSYLTQSLMGLAKMAVFFAGYVVFRVIAHNNAKPVLILMAVLAALGLLESAIGLYQYINHIQPLATWVDPGTNPELRMTRIFGTLQPSNPNLLAGFLIPCLAAGSGLSLMLAALRQWLPSLVFAAMAGVIFVAVVLTGSRGGYLAIVGMLAFFFAMAGHLIWHDRSLKRHPKLKLAWLVVLIVSIIGIGGAFLTSDALRHRAVSMFAMREDSSISYRLNVYNSAVEMFRDNPIVGIGPGNDTFKQVYGLYMVPGYNALGAYSVPLEIAVEQGVLGLLIFLSLLAVLKFRTLLALDAEEELLPEKVLVGVLLAGVLGSFIYGLFDTIWYRPSVNLLFWFFVAALGSLTEKAITGKVLKDTYK